MKTIGCPHNVEVLIWCYTRPNPPPSGWESTLTMFLNEGLIEHFGDDQPGRYSLTEMGEAWLLAMLNTPKPKKFWMDRGEALIVMHRKDRAKKIMEECFQILDLLLVQGVPADQLDQRKEVDIANTMDRIAKYCGSYKWKVEPQSPTPA